MNDDELRRVLRDEADRVEIDEESWSRLESRLQTLRVTSAPRSFAFGAVAIAVVVALVAGVLWFGRDDHDTHVAARVQSSVPSRIVAWTRHDELVVLDSRTGRLVRTLVGDVATGFRGSPALSVTSDGANLYYTDAVPKEDGPGCPGAPNFVMRIPIAGGTPIEVRRGRTAAISPTRGTLASSDDSGVCLRGGGALTLGPVGGYSRLLRGGGLASELVLDHLSWAPDGRHLAFQWLRGSTRTYVLDTKTAASINEAVCVCKQRNAVGFGYLGDTGGFLGSWTPGGTPKAFEKIPFGRSRVVALGADGSVRRTLFAVRGQVEDLASDRGGDHVLAVAAEGGRKFSLSRWSRGDKKPTKIRDGILAAAWIPDSPAKIPAPPIAVVRTDGEVVIIDPVSGATERDLGPSFDASQIAVSPVDGDLLVGVNTSDACGTERAAHIDRIHLADGTAARASFGRFPAVSRSGLMAYEVRCDGITLGFTNLVTGENFRTNPLADAPSEASPNAVQVHPLGWAPSGTRLLYTVSVQGNGRRLYIGRLWPAVAQRSTRVSALPSALQDSAVAFLDDHHLAVATWRNGRTDVRRVEIPGRRGTWSRGERLFEVSGRVTRLAATASGRHLIALMFGGDLLRWTRGDRQPATVATGLDAATWLPGG